MSAGWLDELNAKYGEPRIAYPDPVNLGDRQRECWVWFPDGQNHNVGIDKLRDCWKVSAGAPRRRAELEVRGQDRPSDAEIRGVLVAAGMLAGIGAQA